MKTTFDVLDIFVGIINVTTVTTLLGGGNIYRDKKPPNSKLKDITINPLPISCGHKDDIDLQEGTVSINCFCKNISIGIRDDAYFDSITSAVVTRLEAYTMTTSNYFDLSVISQGVMDDMDASDMSYSSIRVNYSIEFL